MFKVFECDKFIKIDLKDDLLLLVATLKSRNALISLLRVKLMAQEEMRDTVPVL